MKTESQQDKEANDFALCLLVPKQMLIDEISKLQPICMTDTGIIRKLSKIFGVTDTMIVMRIASLKLF